MVSGQRSVGCDVIAWGLDADFYNFQRDGDCDEKA